MPVINLRDYRCPPCTHDCAQGDDCPRRKADPEACCRLFIDDEDDIKPLPYWVGVVVVLGPFAVLIGMAIWACWKQ